MPRNRVAPARAPARAPPGRRRRGDREAASRGGRDPQGVRRQESGHDLGTDDVVAFVKRRLANYKIPGEVAFVDAIPKTPSGKILRRVLKERELDNAARPPRP